MTKTISNKKTLFEIEDAKELLDILPEKERAIVDFRVTEGKTFREISGLMLISKARVHQLFERALNRMRRHYDRKMS